MWSEGIAGGCSFLMEGPGTVRHDRVGTRVHWELCQKYNIKTSARWFEHKFFWNVHHQTNERVEHNKPDVVIEDKASNVVTIIDFAMPRRWTIISSKPNKLRLNGTKHLPKNSGASQRDTTKPKSSRLW